MPPYAPPAKAKVFIVHGHDLGVLAEVEAFVLKANKTPVVLKGQPGENLLDELGKKTKGVQFAIVTATGDDVGASKKKPDPHDRARQNVIFEFGFLIHQLGRKKVFVLHHEGVELPSDYLGVIYVPIWS